ncbi:glycosyl transferase [Haloarcula sp. CBA1115]|uniref:glycosyltransferase n=1 Tax=unclassified Haloarcula TaxID=2624677 RepID=UPI0005955A26|nr:MULTISPECIES: glycosyltransferase [unclassified Haloarcula]AJF25980.1 glycosyl transferase [Haloarcula sp. CBA1115]KAA9405382.1 glycosyltransferase [Haloarcula sp. CBA1131]
MDVLQLVTTRRPFFHKQVEALERHGINCTVLEVPGGDEATRSPMAYLRFYTESLSAAPWQYDLVHANYGLTAPMALAQPTRPVVLSLWGSDIFGQYDRLSRQCATLADEVVVMSSAMADALGEACHVIPHAVDFEQFEPVPTETAKETLGWDDSRYHVLFPYDPDRAEKDHPRAVRVIDAVNERLDTPVSLEVVHGVTHDRVPTYMNAADALILTSTHEGSPNAVKEALACNTPVVSVDVGDVASLIDGAARSAVCADDEELTTALTATLQSSEAVHGRVAVEPLRLNRMAERLTAVYRSAIDRRCA